MLLKVQGYNFKVEYRPGEQVILAVTLSRLPNLTINDDVDLDVKADRLSSTLDNRTHQLSYS